MRRALIALSTLALVPSAAFAQTTCEQRSNQVAGTVAGGALGALLGSAVAGKGHKDDGAIVGALGGAVVGSQIAKPRQNNCAQAYGYYDNQGAWHTTNVQRTQAQGYYDRDGRWVAGVPNGYYDRNGRWVVADSQVRQGYYDDNGRWVPPSVEGYYDDRGRWIASVDRSNYPRDDWRDDTWSRRTIREQSDMLRQRIVRAESDGRLSRRDAREFLDELQEIDMREASLSNRRGQLNREDRIRIQAQLDDLRSDVRAELRG